MNRAKIVVSTIEHLISTKSKQHIVGGLLFSASIFLGALAATVFTMKVSPSEVTNEQVIDPYEYDDEEEYE